ncbi:hypothetical protein PsYK624_106980 [Phanerochaete sordida]|uniref:Protein kinase domain-containing protein n=1 Tax=Phanerochaete sordida TaxID=48140 RepID=A0A9P3LH37_9APHY|nr:hypothetical protein PsYK624_106980 [Phanerochaete sordida]
MSSTRYTALDVYRTYPERNPYDLDPPVYNLVPYGDVEECDTPELKKAALKIAKASGINVLAGMYSHFPLMLGNIDEMEVEENPVSFTSYRPPPPLQRTELPSDVEFVSQVNPQGNTPIFIVKFEGVLRLLKIDPEVDIDDDPYHGKPRKPFEDDDPIDPIALFDREKEAYAHLLHAGVCAAGHVPHCYGWVELSPAHVNAIARIAPDLKYGGEINEQKLEDLRGKVEQGRLPKGILLEYFPDAQMMSSKNVIYDHAEPAIMSMCAIHAAYVHHGDIRGRNMLVLPDARVVWVDFNSATCASDTKMTRLDLFSEFNEVWDLFYQQLLPNRRIGWAGYMTF